MKKIEIDFYDNYRHNAYDGYECSWGVLMGLGGSGNAFTTDEKICGDEHIDEYGNCDCDCPTEMGEALENFDEKLNVETMLQNLDTTIEEIQAGLDDNGEYVHNEYYGDKIPIIFTRDGDNVVVSLNIGKHYKFIVTNLT